MLYKFFYIYIFFGYKGELKTSLYLIICSFVKCYVLFFQKKQKQKLTMIYHVLVRKSTMGKNV